MRRIHELEPLHFTEIHFKPAPYNKLYKRPSSYEVPIHAAPSSYYRQPVSSYTRPSVFPGQPLGPYGPGPGHGLGPGQDPGHGGEGASDSYEVLDDYRPLGDGPAYGKRLS